MDIEPILSTVKHFYATPNSLPPNRMNYREIFYHRFVVLNMTLLKKAPCCSPLTKEGVVRQNLCPHVKEIKSDSFGCESPLTGRPTSPQWTLMLTVWGTHFEVRIPLPERMTSDSRYYLKCSAQSGDGTSLPKLPGIRFGSGRGGPNDLVNIFETHSEMVVICQVYVNLVTCPPLYSSIFPCTLASRFSVYKYETILDCQTWPMGFENDDFHSNHFQMTISKLCCSVQLWKLKSDLAMCIEFPPDVKLMGTMRLEVRRNDGRLMCRPLRIELPSFMHCLTSIHVCKWSRIHAEIRPSYDNPINIKLIAGNVVTLASCRSDDEALMKGYFKMVAEWTKSPFDLWLVVDGIEIPTQTILIAFHSPVLLSMLESDSFDRESRKLQITDGDADTWRTILKFFGNDVPREIFKMYIYFIAHKYQMAYLRGFFEHYTQSSLSVSTMRMYETLAINFNGPSLYRRATLYKERFSCKEAERMFRYDKERQFLDALINRYETHERLDRDVVPVPQTEVFQYYIDYYQDHLEEMDDGAVELLNRELDMKSTLPFSILRQFFQFFMHPVVADVEFCVESEKIVAHSSVLEVRAKDFLGLLPPAVDGRRTLDGVSLAVFKDVLRHTYTGVSLLMDTHCLVLRDFAEKYQLTELQSDVEYFMKRDVQFYM